MSHSLPSAERGVIQPCPACGTANRIAYAKVSQQGRCDTCKADLPLITAPVEMTSPTTFAALISQSPLPVVIDFWAAWCGPAWCSWAMRSRLAAFKQLEQTLKRHWDCTPSPSTASFKLHAIAPESSATSTT